MPAFNQVAAIVTYIRNTWGNLARKAHVQRSD